MTEVLILSRVL